jgi:GTP-binding protein
MKTRRIVVVGRPNVGKSSLFNRLCGRRRALEHDQPGVTRDWTSAAVDLGEGREAELVDTGGVDLADSSPLASAAREAAIGQLREADVLLFVTDGTTGPTAGDFEVADVARPTGIPVVLAVNKIDTKKAIDALVEFHELGQGEPVGVSAQHSLGIEDLREKLREALPEGGGVERPPAGSPRVAVVGRPNVGKSSLVNRLVGRERVIVSEIPGTTRDPVDSLVRVEGRHYVLVDTAGIRARTRTSESPDQLAVVLAEKDLARADVALLVIDAGQGPTGKDAAIGGLVIQARRPVVVLANKWDLVPDGAVGAEKMLAEIRRRFPMLDFAEVVAVSAKTGRRSAEIWKAVDRALDSSRRRIGTGELNRWLLRTIATGPPIRIGGDPAKIRYVAQVAVSPPTFAFFVNRPGSLPVSTARYLENRLRDEFGFAGAPIVFRVSAGKRGRESSSGSRQRRERE